MGCRAAGLPHQRPKDPQTDQKQCGDVEGGDEFFIHDLMVPVRRLSALAGTHNSPRPKSRAEGKRRILVPRSVTAESKSVERGDQ